MSYPDSRETGPVRRPPSPRTTRYTNILFEVIAPSSWMLYHGIRKFRESLSEIEENARLGFSVLQASYGKPLTPGRLSLLNAYDGMPEYLTEILERRNPPRQCRSRYSSRILCSYPSPYRGPMGSISQKWSHIIEHQELEAPSLFSQLKLAILPACSTLSATSGGGFRRLNRCPAMVLGHCVPVMSSGHSVRSSDVF